MDKSSLVELINWLEKMSALFGVIVAIGVVGESYFGVRLLWNNFKLQRIQETENVKAKRETEVMALQVEAQKKANLDLQKEILALERELKVRYGRPPER